MPWWLGSRRKKESWFNAALANLILNILKFSVFTFAAFRNTITVKSLKCYGSTELKAWHSRRSSEPVDQRFRTFSDRGPIVEKS